MNAWQQMQKSMTPSLSVKDISDWIKTAVLIASMFMGYQHLVDLVNSYGKTTATLVLQTQRIERYLSSKDPDYWQKAASLGQP